ncbi:MAG TPA: alpha/beta fold hydrolase [Burkholderiales bacterium]|nr:alpha/beta fold hydrolase [Burkholderiales bacterium]
MRPFRNVHVLSGGFTLEGDLHTTRNAVAVVVLVHGSGVTRRERRNDFIARRLESAGFATLLVDLLEEPETRDRHNVFDVEMQAERLVEVIHWLGRERRTRALPVGLFGMGIGAGIVLRAAARAPQRVRAIVCRGGRPDTALPCLWQVRAPTLFIDDNADAVPDWCATAYRAMRAPASIVRVASRSHLYREPDALNAVGQHAERWFSRHLARCEASEPTQAAL